MVACEEASQWVRQFYMTIGADFIDGSLTLLHGYFSSLLSEMRLQSEEDAKNQRWFSFDESLSVNDHRRGLHNLSIRPVLAKRTP